jgi:hypothetical protein
MAIDRQVNSNFTDLVEITFKENNPLQMMANIVAAISHFWVTLTCNDAKQRSID